MLSLPSAVRIYLGTQPADMRRSFDGLAFLVQQFLQGDPLSGSARGRTHLKPVAAIGNSTFQRFSLFLGLLPQGANARRLGVEFPTTEKREMTYAQKLHELREAAA